MRDHSFFFFVQYYYESQQMKTERRRKKRYNKIHSILLLQLCTYNHKYNGIPLLCTYNRSYTTLLLYYLKEIAQTLKTNDIYIITTPPSSSPIGIDLYTTSRPTS